MSDNPYVSHDAIVELYGRAQREAAQHPDQAIATLREALRLVPVLEPGDPEDALVSVIIHRELSILLKKSNRRAEAIEHLLSILREVEQANRDAPDDADALRERSVWSLLELVELAEDLGEQSLGDQSLQLAWNLTQRFVDLRPHHPDAVSAHLSTTGLVAQRAHHALGPEAALRVMRPELEQAHVVAVLHADDLVAVQNASALYIQFAISASAAGEREEVAELLDRAHALLSPLRGRSDVDERLAAIDTVREFTQLPGLAAEHRAHADSPVSNDEVPDTPRQQPAHTVSGSPQLTPEEPGTPERRVRLYYEAKRLVARHPQAVGEAGHPFGEGHGLAELVAVIRPLFVRDASLIRWVALRGALTSLHQLGEQFLDASFALFGVGLYEDPARGDVTARIHASTRQHLAAEQSCLGLFQHVVRRLARYEAIAQMTADDVNRCADFGVPGIISDAAALDTIVWASVAELRLEASGAIEPVTDRSPPASLLAEPGWYTEPLFATGDRYWDGTDWTGHVRFVADGERHRAYQPLRH